MRAMGTFEGPRDCTKVPLCYDTLRRRRRYHGRRNNLLGRPVHQKADITLIVRNANYTLGRVMRTSLRNRRGHHGTSLHRRGQGARSILRLGKPAYTKNGCKLVVLWTKRTSNESANLSD